MTDNNTIILDDCIEQFKTGNLLSISNEDEIFEIFTALQITKDVGLDISEIEDSIVDGGNDGGIDSFIILINDQYTYTEEEVDDINFTRDTRVKLILIQSKRSKNFKEEVLDKLSWSSERIFDLNMAEQQLLSVFNNKLVEKILTFRKVWFRAAQSGSKISVQIVYASRGDSKNINGVINSKESMIVNRIKDKVSGAKINLDFCGSKEILEFYRKPPKTTLTLNFKENPIPITYLTREDIGFIGVVSLKDYNDFIIDENGNIIEEIFESNIRHFQGNVDVNKRIAKTLENDQERDFWWLNNGITIIASKYSQFPKMLHLEDVQIVNGLQTSYVIHDYFSNDDSTDDQRVTLVKVIISTNKETIDKIISATNSQTAVSPSLLRATDDIQRNLELFFFNKGYYYDRRKNYYKNQNKPTRKIFNIQNLSQFIQAILNFDPASARSKPTSLIKDDKSYNNIFRSDIEFGAYLNCCLLYQQVDDYIRNSISDTQIRGEIRNFSLHLARIFPSVVIRKNKYSSDHIKNINLEDIKKEQIDEALELLQQAIGEYKQNNPSENIINIAKSRKFIIKLEEVLENYVTTLSQAAPSKL